MALDWYIAGDTIVKIEYNLNTGSSFDSELGLSEDPIQITPSFYYHPIHCDAYGGMVPAEELWMLGESTITMTLVHFDKTALERVINTSMGGGGNSDGIMGPPGTPMGGNGAAIGSNDCWYFKLIVEMSELNSYIFPFCYLSEHPLMLPLGTGYSKVRLNITSIPYTNADGAVSSEGNSLWERS